MGDFMRDNAEQIASHGIWVEINCPAFIVRDALAKLFGRGASHNHLPPFAINLEAQRGTLALAPTLACGGLFHRGL
jgi:hypothetical protein